MKSWKIINQQFNANLFPYALHMNAVGGLFSKTCGRPAAADNFVELRNDGELTQGWHWDEYHKAGKFILERLKDPAYAKRVLNNTNKYIDQFFDFAEKIGHYDLRIKSNGELCNYLVEFKHLFETVSSWGALISIVEYEHELLSKEVKTILAEKLKKLRLHGSAPELFQLLTTNVHKTYVVKERDELLRIALEIQKNKQWAALFKKEFNIIITELKTIPLLEKLLTTHASKYKWLSFGFEGPLLELGDTVQSVIGLLRRDPLGLKDEIRKNEKFIANEQRKWQKKLTLNSNEEHLVWVARELGFSKAYRKDIEYHGNYAYHLILTEIARRFYFTPHQAHYLSVEELIEILKESKKVDFNMLQERITLSVYACENLKGRILTGNEAQVYRDHLEKESVKHNIQELSGQCACPGKVRGKVKVIMDQKDYGKFYAHDILVTYATNPNMVPLMKIAKAIITDVGGITCHAAIVSRELNVPCVIGTKIATKVFKDGDELEIDAAKGMVAKI